VRRCSRLKISMHGRHSPVAQAMLDPSRWSRRSAPLLVGRPINGSPNRCSLIRADRRIDVADLASFTNLLPARAAVGCGCARGLRRIGIAWSGL
jgi:hypothetical protein